MFVKRALAVLLVGAALPYLRAPVYDFPPPRPFSGAAWYNPYEHATGRWLMANLHAHGRAWFGLTNGRQTDAEVVRAYRGLGYDVAVVSDYMRIAAAEGVPTIAAYEHGYNAGKTHQVAVGATRVDWTDFPLLQSTSHKQFLIDRVRASAPFVALVHPSGRFGYGLGDMQALTGYQAVEVLNGPFTAEEHWDAALSSGRVVWGVGNDDTHDVTDPRRMAVSWNMIDAASAADADVVAALAAGRSYAIRDSSGRNNHRGDAIVSGVTVANGVLSVSWTGTPATIAFVRQNGETRHTADAVTAARYTLAPDDRYVRAIIKTPESLIFLNPVIRWDGTHLPSPVATVNRSATWLVRVVLAAATTAVALLLWRRPR